MTRSFRTEHEARIRLVLPQLTLQRTPMNSELPPEIRELCHAFRQGLNEVLGGSGRPASLAFVLAAIRRPTES